MVAVYNVRSERGREHALVITGESQIRALIRLLSDEDDRIAKTISGKLVEIGDVAIPLLLEAEIEQPDMARRIESVLDEIRGGRFSRRPLSPRRSRPIQTIDMRYPRQRANLECASRLPSRSRRPRR